MDGHGHPDLRIGRGRAGWTLALLSARSARAAVTYGILVCAVALAVVAAMGLLSDLPSSPAAELRQEAP